jgi:hypothetical protein
MTWADDRKRTARETTWADANFYFEKVADRQTWDFPLVNSLPPSR